MSAAYEQLTGQPAPATRTGQGIVPDPRLAGGGAPGIAVVGLCTILVSAWGGIAPYVGPTFGYRATSRGAWHWDLAHAVVALAPGAIGVIAGLSMLVSGSRLARDASRASLAVAGLLALVAGAWFVVGPSAWPLLRPGAGQYFASTTAFHGFTDRVGTSFGPGIILCAFGAFTAGWAVRHRPLQGVRRAAGGPSSAQA